MRVTIHVVILTLGAAGAALASNAGFKLSYPLVFNPNPGASQLNLISLPYHYYPNGNAGERPQTARAMCLDLNEHTAPLRVLSVLRLNPVSETVTTQSCSSPVSVFDLVPGVAYGVKPSGPGVTIHLVGSHDDSYAPNKTPSPMVVPLHWAPSPASNNNWISIPYHAKAILDQHVCDQVNDMTGDKLLAIVRYNTRTDTVTTKACVSPMSVFTLVPGTGYSLKPCTSGAFVALDVH